MTEEAEFKFHLDGDNSDPKVYGVYKRITATGMEWRVVGPRAKAIYAMLAGTIRERDEARAELQAISAMEDMHIGMLHEAEQRGYRRGVQDAAKVGAEAATYGIWEHDMDRVERAILALLEQLGEKK